MNMFSRFFLTDKLAELGVEILLFTTVEEITASGVTAVDTTSGERNNIEADTVVLAMGFKCNDGLAEQLKGEIPEVYSIGDCVEPGKIKGAVHSAAWTARQI
jgi:2-enoate reductase